MLLLCNNLARPSRGKTSDRGNPSGRGADANALCAAKNCAQNLENRDEAKLIVKAATKNGFSIRIVAGEAVEFFEAESSCPALIVAGEASVDLSSAQPGFLEALCRVETKDGASVDLYSAQGLTSLTQVEANGSTEDTKANLGRGG